MVWSEQIGASIVLPSDRTPGDGRNYITIGEDVPKEIATAFTAALIFRSGNPDQPLYGFDYWALGITTLGALEVVAYWYNWSAAPESGGQEAFFRQTVLSFAPPIGVDKPPVISLGYGAGYGSFGEGPSSRILLNNRLEIIDGGWTQYQPIWTAGGVDHSGTVGTGGGLFGRYYKSGSRVKVRISMLCGSTFNGGNGPFAFTLPPTLPPVTGQGEYVGLAKAFTTAGNCTGFALIQGNAVVPVFSTNFYGGGNMVMNQAQNASVGGGGGTGVPVVAGNFTWGNGSNLTMELEYETAVSG